MRLLAFLLSVPLLSSADSARRNTVVPRHSAFSLASLGNVPLSFCDDDAQVAQGTRTIASVAPGIFTANMYGRGVTNGAFAFMDITANRALYTRELTAISGN